MSGTIAAALAGLLLQQAVPYPSTLEPYRPPVVRPYEPTSNFGREAEAQGDAAGDLHRRPLTAPVAVDAYAGSYEFSPTDAETTYNQAVASAEMRADDRAGPLEGRWAVTAADGAPLFGLVLSDPGDGGLIEGGWRRGSARGGATLGDDGLELEGYGLLTLERTVTGWRGVLTVGDRSSDVVLSRAS